MIRMIRSSLVRDAIAILDTPDEKLDDLIARAEGLRRKYKGNRVSIHILTNARSGNCSPGLCLLCPVLPFQSGYREIQVGGRGKALPRQ